jgi:Flp pilus assembly pilin Flp
VINDKNPASLKQHMRGAETVEYVILAALVTTTPAIVMPKLTASVGDKMTDVSTDLDQSGGGSTTSGGSSGCQWNAGSCITK